MTRVGDCSAASLSQEGGRVGECQTAGEAGGILPRRLQKGAALLTPRFWTSSPQSYEGIPLLFSVAQFVAVCFSSPRKLDIPSFRVLGQIIFLTL